MAKKIIAIFTTLVLSVVLMGQVPSFADTNKKLSAPRNLQATSLTSHSVGITFGSVAHATSYSVKVYPANKEKVFKSQIVPISISLTVAATIDGLAVHTAYRILVTALGTGGYKTSEESNSVRVTTFYAAVNPTIGTPTRNLDGFTVHISNYLSACTYTQLLSGTGGSINRITDTITVTGLTPGETRTITIGSNCPGFDLGSFTSPGISALNTIPPAIATATITGAPAIGQTLTATSTGVSGTPTPTESYQWQSANPADGVFSDISGAISSTYTLLSGDAGLWIDVVVTEKNGASPDASATSSHTDAVEAAAVQCGTGTYLITTAGVAHSGSSCTGPLTIASTVTSIANYGFEQSGITDLTIPGTVITIGQGAFSATKLTTLTLLEGIQSIGFAAFSSGTLFNTAPTLQTVVIPDSVTSIGSSAFAQTPIESLTIGSGLSTISNGAFYNNWGFGASSILFKPGNLSVIGASAFAGTRAINVNIPAGVTEIGKKAFDSETIETIRLPISLVTIFHNATSSDGILGNGIKLATVYYCGTNNDVLNYLYPNSVVTTCTPGVADSSQSTVSVSPSSITADGSSQSTITVMLKDFNGNPLNTGSATITFVAPILGTISAVTDNADGTYSATYTAGSAEGSETITPKLSSVNFSKTATITLTADVGPVIPTSLITDGDFTIQMWVKPTAGFNSTNRNELFAIIAPDTGAYPRLDIWYGDGYTPIWSVYTDSSHSVGLINNTASFPSLGSPAVEGQWHNIVVARHSGRVHIFYDGVDQLAADFDNTQDFTLFTKLIIGQDPSYWTDFTKNGDAHADIYGLRIVDGQDLFLTDFVPSAAPPTAVPGTSFLLSELISPNTDNSLVLNSASYYSYIFGTDTSLVSHGTSPVSTSELPRLTCDPSKICGLGDLGPAGGIVFYHDANGFACGAENVSGVTSPKSISTCHYLEVAPSGWNTTSDPLISWADSANNSRIVTGTQSAIGTGLQNSIDIASIDPDQVPASTAAMAARAYTSIVSASTYADWYLPSQDELNLLCQWNRGIAQNVTVTCTGGTINSGTGAISAGFVENIYWSSTEWDGSNALWQNFAGDTRNGATKSLLLRVRPIRAF